ncbi:hypothetical protein FSP39_006399 [Pinctada imbricata]|uniref:G-protein coupled receptors family 3 profile domain-containing protein n=1 Tax=Pinctada imbricata TaxID=66713 RepID=A0AA88YK09_PINIB|nr:hypothetical protein FSP39_006399 [Pinctada imbricata]
MEVRTIGPGTFAVSCIVTTIGIVFSVGFLTFNVFHRKKRFIKMSSPKLNVMISSGGLSLNIACLMYGMDFFLEERYPEATVTCQIRLWLVTLGFTLVFGPMFAKAWRVYLIFRNAGIKRVVIRDTKLFMMSSIFMLVDIVILVLWQSIDIMKSQKVKYLLLLDKEENGSSVMDHINIQECSSSGTSVWLSILFLWKTGLLGFGLYLAWKTRNVMLPAMRDSVSMIVSILTTLLLTAPTIMLTSLLRHSPNAIYITEMTLITVCVSVVQVATFLPKKASHIKQLQDNLRQARRKLSKLSSDQEGKLDSGLDVDMSTSSSHDDTTQDPQQTIATTNNSDPNSSEELLQTPRSQRRTYRSNSDTESVQSYRKRRRKFTKKMTSTPNLFQSSGVESKKDINEDDIATKQQEQNVYENEMNITNSLSRKGNPFPRGTTMYESIRSRQDIAGSVAKSYDLEDNDDTFSYVSSYLNPTFPKKNLDYTLRNSTLCISAECVSAIDNDKLYPYPGDLNQSNCTSESRDISISRETLDGSKRVKNQKNRSKKQAKSDKPGVVILDNSTEINSCCV